MGHSRPVTGMLYLFTVTNNIAPVEKDISVEVERFCKSWPVCVKKSDVR